MPSLAAVTIDVAARNATLDKSWYTLLANMHTEFPELQDAGLHGYYTMSGSPRSFSVTLLQYNQPDATSAKRLIQPLQRTLIAANSSATHRITTQWFSSWYTMVKGVPCSGCTGTTHSVQASRLIPRRSLEDVDLLSEVLRTVASLNNETARHISNPPPNSMTSDLNCPQNGVSSPSISGTMTASKMPVNNSLNPAWRDTVVHLITKQTWDDTVPEEMVNQAIQKMTYGKGYALRQLAPDSGAYFNEAYEYEPPWQSSLFGSNCPRLLFVKQKYDPDSVLWCPHCVGSEAWALRGDGTLCQAL
ncbi:uncharacterized protein DSM5745_03640 [Aspergillus mulundensis]|uniref:Berberine/berberine-like domain-containing protein n=1 Tax=Aspergillus mulundensis TaxID=1810919 RepID=A0A3D8SMH1_9EURO|nr:hypothetical protein DSM5745_03640 [Aspergillus mulundensis]RDW86998.1 hypothetical protein DSM5745_03640 [Aspergillus mulundensis]